MHDESLFRSRLDGLHREGRALVFADLARKARGSPRAVHYADDAAHEVTVWCSTDYPGKSQDPDVLAAMHGALERCGAGGIRSISGANHDHVELDLEFAELHGKEAAPTFTSGYVSNWAAPSPQRCPAASSSPTRSITPR